LPESERVAYTKTCYWWIGLSGVVFGSIGDFVAFSIASQELVVAVGCAAVLSCNIVVSIFWHHEVMGWTDGVGIICVLIGAVVFALAAPASEDYTATELASKFKRTVFLVLLVCQIGCIMTLISFISTSRMYKVRIKCQYRCFRALFSRYDKQAQKNADINATMLERVSLLESRLSMLEGSGSDPLSASMRDAAHKEALDMTASASSDVELIDDEDRDEQAVWDSYIYAACSGTAGGMMALFAGCASKALKQTFDGDNQFGNVWTYVFIIGLVLFILWQTHFLNRAMMLGDLMAVIPTFQAFWIVFGVFSGMAFYGHDEGLSFPGILLMIVGVIFLLQHPGVIKGEDVLGAKEKLSCVATGCGCEPSFCGLNDKEKDEENGEGEDVNLGAADAISPPATPRTQRKQEANEPLTSLVEASSAEDAYLESKEKKDHDNMSAI